MSFLKHRVYGLLFNLFRYTGISQKRISFITDSKQSFNGNLDYIKKEFEKRGDFEFCFFYKDKLSLSALRQLAGSHYIFLNDNFFPLAFMNFSSQTIITQLWHAPGASKKFGASADFESRDILKKISENTDYLITTSKNINVFYSEAFQMPQDKIKALGLPRLDYYFENHDIDLIKNNFYEKYNIPSDKKLILYAPTFRQSEKFNNVFDFFDLKRFNEALGDEYTVLLRLHPKIRDFCSDDISSDGEYVDVSDFKNEQELMLLSDMMITDYSSIMIEYSILNRPIIFFTYDLDNYLDSERGFYYDFKETVPGPVALDMDDLIEDIRFYDFDDGKKSDFIHSQFDEIDGQSSKRVVDFILNGEVFDE